MNEFNTNELTVIVNTCDSYSDVLSLFFSAFNEYWPDCPHSVVINSEKNVYREYSARTHNYLLDSTVSNWGDRLKTVLMSVDSEYVLTIYDDFILENHVCQSEINDVIELMKSNKDIAVVYLINTSLALTGNLVDEKFREIKDFSDYKLNSAPAIWRRADLISYTGSGDNPWAWEVFGSYRTYADGKLFYSLAHDVSDIFPYNYKKGGAIYRGKWVRDVVANKFEKYNLSIDPAVRGYTEDLKDISRDFRWKLEFMLTGYKMVGLKSLRFVYRYAKEKLSGRRFY